MGADIGEIGEEVGKGVEAFFIASGCVGAGARGDGGAGEGAEEDEHLRWVVGVFGEKAAEGVEGLGLVQRELAEEDEPAVGCLFRFAHCTACGAAAADGVVEGDAGAEEVDVTKDLGGCDAALGRWGDDGEDGEGARFFKHAVKEEEHARTEEDGVAGSAVRGFQGEFAAWVVEGEGAVGGDGEHAKEEEGLAGAAEKRRDGGDFVEGLFGACGFGVGGCKKAFVSEET